MELGNKLQSVSQALNTFSLKFESIIHQHEYQQLSQTKGNNQGKLIVIHLMKPNLN